MKLLNGLNMDNLLIRQAISDLSLEVRNYHKNRDGKSWNWSCVVCGDSKMNRRKARFGVTIKDGSAVCHCYNCGYANPFVVYLKEYHTAIYERYVTEEFLNKAPTLYDLNHLVEGSVSDKVLSHIFYIDKFSNPKIWLQHLEHKKIQLKEKNLKKLYQLHKAFY